MPERIDYWGIPHTWGSPDIFVYSILGLASLIMLIRFYFYARLWWGVGRSEKRWDRLDIRLGRLIKYAIIQIKVLWERYPGVMHIGLAWGFFAFFMGTALATVDSHFVKILRGDAFLLYKLVLDQGFVILPTLYWRTPNLHFPLTLHSLHLFDTFQQEHGQ